MRKVNLFIIVLLVALSVISSCSREINFSEKISGKWYLVKVLELNEDVTETHNPGKNRWISFNADPNNPASGGFKSGTSEKTENTGKWFFNKEINELHLDSDAGEEDDSYWEVSFSSDSMYWKGKKFDFNMRFEVTHKKAGEGS